jgi:hypothetical protein
MLSPVVSIFSAVTKFQGLAPRKLPDTTLLTILIICYLPYFWDNLFPEPGGAKGEWEHNGPRKHVAPSVIIPAANTRFLPSHFLIFMVTTGIQVGTVYRYL